MNTICGNMMCLNEPFAVYAISSVMPYLDRFICTDTGSDDGTYEELQTLQKKYPDKLELRQEKIEKSHNWSIENTEVKSSQISPTASKQLADLRRTMHKDSEGYTWVWLVDGDELYPRYLANKVCQLASNGGYRKDVIIPSFIDWIYDLKHIRAIHWMCRLFRQETTEIRNDFPAEQHYQKYTNTMYEAGCSNSLYIPPEIGHDKYYNDELDIDSCVTHLESIIKPWRKDKQVIDALNQPYRPEIIDELYDKFPRIQKYI